MRQNGFYVSVRKTTVVEVDESSHHLPPDNGPFVEYKVADWNCPDEWSKDGIFIPVKEGDPMWFDFRGNYDCAILCAVQRLNPVTGEPANLEGGLSKDPQQNYLRMPEQQWLDGYAKDGKVYQFVVTKAGEGLAVNEFVLPKHMQDSHAVGFAFFGAKNPKPRPANLPRSVYVPPDSQYFKCGAQNYDAKFLCSTGGGTKGMSSGGPVLGSGLRSFDNLSTPTMDSDFEAMGATADCLNDEIDDCIVAASASLEQEEKTCGRMAGPADPDGGAAYAEAVEEIVEAEVVDRLEDDVDHTQFKKASMGMGGRITQLIHTDDNTVEYYTEKPAAVLTIYFCLPEQFEAIMKQGKRQDPQKKDKYVHSGEVGGVQVPLVKSTK
jgi:hypothetical protein